MKVNLTGRAKEEQFIISIRIEQSTVNISN